MAKPRGLGYRARAEIDGAMMSCADALREMRPLVDEKLPGDEQARRVARAICRLYETINALHEVLQLGEKEPG